MLLFGALERQKGLEEMIQGEEGEAKRKKKKKKMHLNPYIKKFGSGDLFDDNPASTQFALDISALRHLF